jgi:hypothetical protein
MNTNIMITAFSCFIMTIFAEAQLPLGTGAKAEDAIQMVRQIYRSVSSSNGEQVNWEEVRESFIEEAVIVLRTSPTETKQFSREGFIQDFKDFYKNPVVEENGFREEVLEVDARVYLDMAYIGVVYEASIPDSGRPGQKGVDFWLVQKREEGWKVLAVSNEIIPPGEEIPGFFQNE